MPLPSLQVLGVAAADPALFEHLMHKVGFKLVQRDNDPLSTHVQTEAVSAIASAITEDTTYGIRLSPYHKQAKILAERAGYVVMVENCGPPGEDPCEDDADSSEDPAMAGPMDSSRELDQVAALPIGTDLAAEILAVIKGEGPAGLTDEMPVDELPPEEPMLDDEMVPVSEVGEGEAMLAAGDSEPKEFPPEDDHQF